MPPLAEVVVVVVIKNMLTYIVVQSSVEQMFSPQISHECWNLATLCFFSKGSLRMCVKSFKSVNELRWLDFVLFGSRDAFSHH